MTVDRYAVLSPPGLLGPYIRRALETVGASVDLFVGLDALRQGLLPEHKALLVAPWVERLPANQALSQLRAEGLKLPRTVGFVFDGQAQTIGHNLPDSGVNFDHVLTLPFSRDGLLSALQLAQRTKPRILLVDDSELIRRHTKAMLEEAGYAVLLAEDGEAGLLAAKQHIPNLILTDVEMPKRDGFSLCQAIRQEPSLLHLPVVICSTLGEVQDLERGFDAGADDYLVKPVVAEELVARLSVLLAQALPMLRENILVVDDSAPIRHLVADCLRRQGFSVTSAIDGQDGLEKALGQVALAAPFDLVLTDYDMPRMTGFELVHALKRDPKTRDVPIVMLTARDGKRDQAQMRAAGLTSYLVKPFSTDKCLAIVERVLAEARLRRYKDASRLYLSAAGVKAAEDQATGDRYDVRAIETDATVLFSDVSGFTAMSATMTAPEVIALMNAYFDEMCPVIVDFLGDIDKFIGDAIMAVFQSDPRETEPHVLRAVRAAFGMQRALDRFNTRRKELDINAKSVVMRIGLNAGTLVRGDLGSRFVRRDYTCIGDTVNRAQRHESACPLGEVLMSASVYERVREHVVARELPGIHLKGLSEPVSAWIVESIQ